MRLSCSALILWETHNKHILGSIVVSISACHAEDPGSIPGRGALFIFLSQTFFKAVPKEFQYYFLAFESNNEK